MLGCGMLGMWDVGDVGCWGCRMLDVGCSQDMRCSGCGICRMWDVWDVECSQDVGCSGCGMWNVYRDVGCLFTKCLIKATSEAFFSHFRYNGKNVDRLTSLSYANWKEVIMLSDETVPSVLLPN